MQTKTIPVTLQSIQKLLVNAFPTGVPSEQYIPLLTILEPELSDRNLALVIANITNKDYSEVLNDIYKLKSHQNQEQDTKLIESVRSLLDTHGYQTWLEQE
jgi:hypothetical protein